MAQRSSVETRRVLAVDWHSCMLVKHQEKRGHQEGNLQGLPSLVGLDKTHPATLIGWHYGDSVRKGNIKSNCGRVV